MGEEGIKGSGLRIKGKGDLGCVWVYGRVDGWKEGRDLPDISHK